MIDALNANAIPRWQRVDWLAEALLKLKGLAVSKADCALLAKLFQDLPYNRKPVVQNQHVHKRRPGRFARQQRPGNKVQRSCAGKHYQHSFPLFPFCTFHFRFSSSF